MIPFFKKFTLALCLTAAVCSFSGCGSSKAEETTVPPTLEPIVLPTAPKETEATVPAERLEEHLTAVMTAGELYTLDYYPNLKTVDLSGSTCYSAIADFASKRPHLDITYSVSVGATDLSTKASSASSLLMIAVYFTSNPLFSISAMHAFTSATSLDNIAAIFSAEMRASSVKMFKISLSRTVIFALLSIFLV